MNLVITFSRRYGSGTSVIVQNLVKEIRENTNLKCSVYDKSYFEGKDNVKNFDDEQNEIKKIVQESNKNDNEVLIFIGRASAFALKDYPNALHIYCYAAKEDRIERIMEKYNLSRQEAFLEINKKDKEREEYHFKYTNQIWGEVDTYQILLDTSKYGISNCGKLLFNYLELHNYI